ncbi:MAG: trehalose-6-phosphate synthase, partial [Burkholderiales bacterium]
MLRDLILRFGLPLITAIGIVTVFAMPLVERGLTEWFRSDVEQRARLVMRSIEESLGAHLTNPSNAPLGRFLGRVTSDERLVAIVICDRDGGLVYRTEVAPREIECQPKQTESQSFQLVNSPQGLLHLARFRLDPEAGTAASVIIAHDLSFIDRRQTRARDYLVAFAALGAGLLVVICVLIAWLVMRSWAKRLVRDIRGRAFLREPPEGGSANLVLDQVRSVLREIEEAQRLESDFRENWTPEALQHVVREHLGSAQMIVVSNREPYIHMRDGDRVTVELPASGMVTALEPIMRACSGTWVAHGGGSADRETVDAEDRVSVPPDAPTYTLRRVWLTEEEEQGYYYGFSNEGLWPLCHLAFVRPAFRPSNWERYVEVNRRFADAVVAEARGPNPIILVQD